MALLIPQVIVHITVHGMYTSDCVAGTCRGVCYDSVPHVWLARTWQTCLHWLSGRDAGYNH